MESVIILAPTDYVATLRSRIPVHYRVTDGADHAIVIEDGSKRIYVWESERIANDYDPAELLKMTRGMESPHFYSVDFHDVEFCRELLLAIANDPKLFVDSNHGVALPGTEFADLLRSKPDWDWRFDRPRV